jgi:hypothetical protein
LLEGCAYGVHVESGFVLGVHRTLTPPGIHVSQAGKEMLAGEVARRMSTWAAEVVGLESDVRRLGMRVPPVRATAGASELSPIWGSGLDGARWRIKRFPMSIRLLAAWGEGSEWHAESNRAKPMRECIRGCQAPRMASNDGVTASAGWQAGGQVGRSAGRRPCEAACHSLPAGRPARPLT